MYCKYCIILSFVLACANITPHSKILSYLVSIQETIGNSTKHICSGTVLRKEWILTAAHCLYNMETKTKKDASTLWVSHRKTANGTPIPVQEIHVHPEYENCESWTNDFGVIRTSRYLNTKSRTKGYVEETVPVPDHLIDLQPRQAYNDTCLIVAYAPKPNTPDLEIKYCEVFISPVEECKKKWPLVNSSVLCTSRSKLITVFENGTYVRKNITSSATKCPTEPGAVLLCSGVQFGVSTAPCYVRTQHWESTERVWGILDPNWQWIVTLIEKGVGVMFAEGGPKFKQIVYISIIAVAGFAVGMTLFCIISFCACRKTFWSIHSSVVRFIHCKCMQGVQSENS